MCFVPVGPNGYLPPAKAIELAGGAIVNEPRWSTPESPPSALRKSGGYSKP